MSRAARRSQRQGHPVAGERLEGVQSKVEGIDDLARTYGALADAHSRERNKTAAYVAGQLGIDPLTAALILVEDEDDEIDLDDVSPDHEHRRMLERRSVPGLEARVLCLRQLNHQATTTAERIGARLGWDSADARRILHDYWMSTTDDGHPDGFGGWLRMVASDCENAAE